MGISIPMIFCSSTLVRTLPPSSTSLFSCIILLLVTLQFEPRTTMGRPPSSRGYHVSVLADSRLFIFGGFDGHTVFDDVHILDLAAAAYLPQVVISPLVRFLIRS